MNNDRRKAIDKVLTQLYDLAPLIEFALGELEGIRDEEQDAYDNMPEGLQQSERGQASEQAISELEDAISTLQDWDVDTIISSLETAQE